MNFNEHRSELVRGVASIASLFSLLVGIPMLLVIGVGWPLPQEIPSGSEALTALKTGAYSPSLILKPISVVVWVLWLQMLAGVGIELWAHFHGRVAPRVLFIPSFMQRLSARLMGTVLVIAFSIQHPGALMADNQELLAPTTAEIDADQIWGIEHSYKDGSTAPVEAMDEVPTNQSTDAAPLVHTVSRRDSLRVLAERYLGDPDRWTEVFVLNQGQTQADGETLTDPARLQPGWELVMPADARLPTSAEVNMDEAPVMSQQPAAALVELDDLLVTVQEGDTLWGLAAHHLNDPQRWVDIFNSNQDIIHDPSVILPGWELKMPALDVEPAVSRPPAGPLPPPDDHATPEAQPLPPPDDHATPVAQPLPPPDDHATPEAQPLPPPDDHATPEAQPLPPPDDHATPVAAYTTSRPTVVAGVASPSVERPSAASSQTMFAIGGLGVFASSLGWVLARLRRTQRRRMPTGRMPVPPSETAVHLHQELQAAADPDSALFLDASLRVLSSRVAGNPPPDIVGVTLSSNSVSIHLSAPDEAPPGFHTSDDSATWTIPRDTALENLLAEADGVPAPLPTLATVGRQDGHECLLNLEHLVALSLEGNPMAIDGLCSAMATQLASSHLADDLTVLCVGFGQDLTVFERVDYVPDVASAIERIRHQQRQNQAMLGNHPVPLDRRLGSSDDFCHPMVTLVPGRVGEEEAAQLLEVCDQSVCAVAHGLDGATWVGLFDEDGLLLQPIGLRLEPYGLPGNALAAVAELASTAKDTEGVVLAVPPSSHLVQHRQDASADDLLDVDIEVRVMGTVEMVGAAQPFTSRRALDLVAYLAFHPEGADRDQLRTHIWPPDDPPSKSTLANTVSRARRALGANGDNEPYLPRVSPEGIYRLAPGVGTDVSRFEALVSAARDESGDRGREYLRSALGLVRGMPFTGGAGDMFRWADFGLRTHIDCLVDTAAHELAKRCLDAGDVKGARHAVMTSLQLVGVCEQCYRWRLMAAAENPTEVRQIMAELLNLLKRESGQPEADDLISPDLLELYEELMSGRSLFK